MAQKKSQHGKHGEIKSESIYARLTPSGKAGLEKLAERLNLSVGELLEQVGREQILLASSSLSGES